MVFSILEVWNNIAVNSDVQGLGFDFSYYDADVSCNAKIRKMQQLVNLFVYYCCKPDQGLSPFVTIVLCCLVVYLQEVIYVDLTGIKHTLATLK